MHNSYCCTTKTIPHQCKHQFSNHGHVGHIQPKNDDVNEDATYDEVLPHEKYARNQPIIPVSRESNEPIVEWTDNKTLFTGAFQDKFLFGQGVPTGLPTQQNWKHFSLCYDG